MANARVAQTYVEVIVSSAANARVAQTYVEVIVTFAKGGWSVGFVRIG